MDEPPALPPALAGALVFTTSGAVLVLEILAVRLLAPVVGASIETTTAIIGTALAGIAAGTWAGGWLADRRDPRRLLGPLLATGGALAIVAVPVTRAAGPSTVASAPSTAVVLAVVALFPAAAVLSAVSPAVVKLRLRDLGETGRVVGRLSALGTAGAILGTFVAGFVLVRVAPTSTTIVVLGVVLVAAGLGLWAWLYRGGGRGAVAVVLATAAGLGLTAAVDGPCDVETTYHCARIEADPDRPTGRVLWLDTLRHSYVDLADPTHLEFRYTRVIDDVIAVGAPAGAIDVVHVGGGGFTLPRHLRAVRPGSRHRVLEIDEGLVRLAEERLGLRPGDDLVVEVGDARLLLAALPPASADVVIGDAFGGVAVPWHLTTREAVSAIQRVLRPGGLYVANLIDHPPLRFARAQLATLAAVFPHVAVVAPPEVFAGTRGGNVVVVGSAEPLDEDALRARVGERDGTEAVRLDAAALAWAGGASVLTDDHAPVDQWLAQAVRPSGP